MALRIRVAICTYDRYDLLSGAIASVLPQLDGTPHSLVVVDNSPNAGRAAGFALRYCDTPGVSFVHEPVEGVANARNTAAAQCNDDDVIAFIDDDARADPGWLAAIAAAFDRAPDAVHGGPVEPLWPDAKPPWLHDGALSYLSMVDLGQARRELGPSEWLAGTNMALPVGALRAAGGFDTRLGRFGAFALLSNEDIEVQRQVRSRGGAIYYDPGAVVCHIIDPARLTQSWFRRRVAWQAISNYVVDPARVEDEATLAEHAITRFLIALPPSQRDSAALGREVPSQDLFRLQLRANYLIQCRLLTGQGPPPMPAAT